MGGNSNLCVNPNAASLTVAHTHINNFRIKGIQPGKILS